MGIFYTHSASSALVVYIPNRPLLPWFMQERHDRLRQAWMASGLSQAQCVERFGWNRNTLKSNINGNSGFGWKMAQEYARAFGVRAEWLMEGTEPMRPIRTAPDRPLVIPFISWVAAGDPAELPEAMSIEQDNMITATDLPPGNYFATTVRGDSMDRLSPDGSTIIVDTADKLLLRGRPYLFSRRGEATFKLWEPEPIQHLAPYSTNPSHKPIFLTGDIEWNVIGRVRRSIYDFA